MTDAGMGIQPTYNLAERDNDGFGNGFWSMVLGYLNLIIL